MVQNELFPKVTSSFTFLIIHGPPTNKQVTSHIASCYVPDHVVRLHLHLQCGEASDTDTHVTPSTTGGMRTTARTATELAETSEELKRYLGLNSLLLEQYSHELLHVQSLAAQLVQMSNMQHQPQ